VTTELSASDEWATDPRLFALAAREYGPFDLDVAADEWNAKAPRFISRRRNALKTGRFPRCKRGYDNPPYSKGNKAPFLSRARAAVLERRAELFCNVVPASTAEGWWHELVEKPAGRYEGAGRAWTELGAVTQTRWRRLWVEVTLVRGRAKHVERSGATGSARHSTAVVVFARPGVLRRLA
jgi:phage N-6-adenine-methyltransferase